MTSNHQNPNSPAEQVEKHILENACASYWLRSTYQLAIRRDPVDALNDAELLASALRARTLGTLSEGAGFHPEITSALLKQHADALSHLSEACVSPTSTADDFRLKRDISDLVLQLHQIARELAPQDANTDPPPSTDLASLKSASLAHGTNGFLDAQSEKKHPSVQ